MAVMLDKRAKRTDIHDLSAHQLTPETFEPVYNTLLGLKFPMDVAQVLELRYLINHAVDAFPEPAMTPDYREFCDALQTVIDVTGVENKRHSERMLRIMSLMRDLHYTYSVHTRDDESALRAEMTKNRQHRRQSVRYCLLYTVAMILAAIVWTGLQEPGWIIESLTAGFAIGAWLHLHTMPALDRKLKALEKRMNDLQRHRVRSIHWRALVHKLALVLGFKHNSEVEVFRIDNDFDRPYHSQVRH
ncbi:MAG: hypothetical protein HY308_06525 [Gammaproteobacteria bacterium]|nr:hypothetical protein [Gammaproteobacteria bacterium]